MPGPTWSDIHQRLKDRLIDPNNDQWSEAQLKEWYDQGSSIQHRSIIDNAAQTSRIFTEHPYLRYFKARDTSITTVANTRDYDLPAGVTVQVVLRVQIDTPTSIKYPLRKVSIAEDARILRMPNQYGPTDEDPFYAFTTDGKIRLYLAGDASMGFPPTWVTQVYIDYIRDVTKTTGANVDLLDPWNTGPVGYAIGIAKTLQQIDPSPWMQEASVAVQTIMPPPPPPQQMRGA